MNRSDFLLEIRTEEIPAAALGPARLDLARVVVNALAEEGLAPENSRSLATPRRLILILRGLPERQEDRATEVVGPSAATAFDAKGHPTRAAEGFAAKHQVKVTDLVVVDSPRGKAVAARRTVPGRPAMEVLADTIPRVLPSMTFPKTMRWGKGEHVFVRPI